MTYLPGSFFVVDVPGPGRYLIGLAQALVNDASRYRHAGLILDADGTILEAEPGGARLANISEYEGDGLLVSDAPVRERVARSRWKSNAQINIESTIRGLVVREARKLVGTPYSVLDYVALAALRLHLPSGWVRRRVETSGHMICSQLVDAAYLRAGIHLYDDGRLPGDVMPADLAAYAEDQAAKS